MVTGCNKSKLNFSVLKSDKQSDASGKLLTYLISFLLRGSVIKLVVIRFLNGEYLFTKGPV
jgi:hypothetical protein